MPRITTRFSIEDVLIKRDFGLLQALAPPVRIANMLEPAED